MKKMGMAAIASGAVRSMTRCPASMPALLTLNTMYVSFDMWHCSAWLGGSRDIKGAKTFCAQETWQTMLHSRGVTEMLRKWCLLSSERPERGPSGSRGVWVGPP